MADEDDDSPLRTLGVALAAAVVGGVAGWVLENLVAGPRYSHLLGGQEGGVPFLPIYAAGATAVVLGAPHLSELPVFARFGVYAAGLTGLEYAACKVERAEGQQSWDYEGSCVDVPHSLAWGGLALVAEHVAERAQAEPPALPESTEP